MKVMETESPANPPAEAAAVPTTAANAPAAQLPDPETSSGQQRPGTAGAVSQFLLNGLACVTGGKDLSPAEAERFLGQVAETARKARTLLDIARQECPA